MPQGFAYGGQTILSHPLFIETILPFLLIFTIVFAVLQKSKIFGDGTKQINAIVALVFGLLAIAFAQATGIIIQLVPFLAVSLVIILVFMILVGSFGKSGDSMFSDKWKTWMTGVILLAVAIAVIYITGVWQTIYDWFLVGDANIIINIIFVIIIIVAIAIVVRGSGSGSGDKGKENK